MKITGVETYVIDVPQKYPVAPYQSRYIATSSTGALLVRLECDQGVVGWGEAPQRLSFQNAQCFTGHEADMLRPLLVGHDPTAIGALYAGGSLDGALDGTYVQSAVEMAMWDMLGKICGQPLYRLLGGPCRDEVELACCLGIRPAEEMGRIAREYASMGFGTLKIKAGRSIAEDLAVVRAIRDAVGDRLALRVDPNTGYGPEECLELARALEPYELEYLEQPMADTAIEESARIRKQTRTPLALNESVTTLARVRQILDLEAAAFLLPDTHQCGGVRAVKTIGDVAASAGVPCVFHCSHDFGLKTAAMLHVAAASPNFPLPNDCTYYGLTDDILPQPLEIRQGRMRVPQGPGLGVEVDEAKVRKYLVGSSTAT